MEDRDSWSAQGFDAAALLLDGWDQQLPPQRGQLGMGKQGGQADAPSVTTTTMKTIQRPIDLALGRQGDENNLSSEKKVREYEELTDLYNEYIDRWEGELCPSRGGCPLDIAAAIVIQDG